MSQQSSQWNLGRFLKTLCYFDAFPLAKLFRPLMRSSQENEGAIRNQSIPQTSQGVVLLKGETNQRQQIEAVLQEAGISVRSMLSMEVETALIPGKFAIAVLESSAFDALTAEIRQQFTDRLKQVRSPQRLSLFDFSQANASQLGFWGALDDVVMGGASESGLQQEGAIAVFTGNVSTANSGGFASVRTRNFEPPLNLSRYSQFELRLRGDGQRYKFLVRCENRWDGVAYSYSFNTVQGEWLTLQIPFIELIPVFRAKTVRDGGQLDAERVTSVQLMLSKFEYDGALNPSFSPGTFRLEVESIAVSGEAVTVPIVLVADSAESDQRGMQWLQNEGFQVAIAQPETLIETLRSIAPG